MKKAYVILSGNLKGKIEDYKKKIDGSPVYCGDGGANYLYSTSIIPNEIWGDMDSVHKEKLDYFESKGSVIKRFSREKNFTDGELILQYVSEKYDEVFVIGAFGGFLGHTLTNTNLLFKYKNVKFITENEEIFSIENMTELDYKKGTTVSFVPFTDLVEGLTLEGFKYGLDDYSLFRGDSRCMSNEVEGNAKVCYKNGKLLCIVETVKRK